MWPATFGEGMMHDATKATEPLLLTIDAAGKLLGMSGRALRRADQCRKVPAPVRIGRNVRWRAAELSMVRRRLPRS